ncbi:hypothetical protein AV274_2774, partial [Blastocystis sp. ATCC 50177/Nand II]
PHREHHDPQGEDAEGPQGGAGEADGAAHGGGEEGGGGRQGRGARRPSRWKRRPSLNRL